jgi:hypothetical protein
MKTLGGYEIKEFGNCKKTPDEGNLRALVYKGTIFDPKSKMEREIRWTIDGRCTNPARHDCYIDMTTFNQI